MKNNNICPFCVFSIPREDGLVDCLKEGCGNAYSIKCDKFRENPRLAHLKETAIESIREFERLNAVDEKDNRLHLKEVQKAACHSCALQEAYAIMLAISYDLAAEWLHEEARNEKL